MGETFEVPISKVFNDGYDAVANFMREPGGLNKPFLWLSLIYLKTHLKDLSLRMHRDLCLQQMVHQESFVQGSEARFMLALPFEDPAACLRMIDEYVDSMVEKPEEGQ